MSFQSVAVAFGRRNCRSRSGVQGAASWTEIGEPPCTLDGGGFFAGLANGVILGYLMYRSDLVPRGMTWLGLIGGPLVMITGILVMYDAIEEGVPFKRSRRCPRPSGSCH
jgi:hypothetical protein